MAIERFFKKKRFTISSLRALSRNLTLQSSKCKDVHHEINTSSSSNEINTSTSSSNDILDLSDDNNDNDNDNLSDLNYEINTSTSSSNDILDLSDDNNDNYNDNLDIDYEEETFDHEPSSRQVKQKLKYGLLNLGLESYLKSTLGGKKSNQEISTMASRLVDYISYVVQDLIEADDKLLDSMINALLMTPRQVLVDYCSLLERTYKPATIVHYLETLKAIARWLSDIKRPSLKGKVDDFLELAKTIRKSYSREVKKQTKKAKTIQCAIHEQKIPVAGLQAIQQAILTEVKLFNGMFQLAETRLLWQKEKSKYDFFMGVLFTSLYAFSPQGRIGGITVAKLHQSRELIEDGQTLVDDFKTDSTYIFQPVTSSNTSRILLGLYIGYMRPSVLTKPYDPLWLNHNGETMSSNDISLLVRLFSEKTMGIRLTSTAIRSIVETEMDKMLDNNRITVQQRNAVHKVNGHSSQISNTYYVMKERHQNGIDSCAAFASLQQDFSNEPLEDFECLQDLVGDIEYPEREHQLQWGSSHPQGGLIKVLPRSTGKVVKFSWSPDEISYLKNWITFHRGGHNTLECSRCLKFIFEDPTATPIFLQHHIATTARLRSGYRRAEKELQLGH